MRIVGRASSEDGLELELRSESLMGGATVVTVVELDGRSMDDGGLDKGCIR